MSRYPRKISSRITVIREQPNEFDNSTCSTVENAPEFSSIFATNEMRCVTIDHISTAAQSNPQYQDLLKIIKTGFPAKCIQTESGHLQECCEVCHRLSIYNNLALLDKCIAIPRVLQKVVLDDLHSANQGVTGMRF